MYETIGRSLRHRLLPHRRPAHRRGARLLAPHPRFRRRRGAAGHQRLLGAGRVPVAADREAGRAGHRRRRHRGLRLPADEPDRRRADPHGAQPRRRQPRHLPRRPGRPGHAVDRDARLGGAEAALAAGDGPAGQARRLRAHRADARLGLGRAGDHRPPRRRHLGDQRREEVDRQRHHRRRRRASGPATRPTARSRASSSRRAPPATRSTDRRQGLAAGGLAGRDHAHRRAGRPRRTGCPARTASRTPAGCSPAPATPSRGAPSATPPPPTRSPLSYCRRAHAVRQAAGQLPDRAGQAGQDARRGVLDAAVLPAARPADRGGQAHRHHRRASRR